MSRNFLETVRHRRSVYHLGRNMPVADDTVVAIIETAVKYAPSPFNCQSPRAVLLLGDKHLALWNGIVLEALRPKVDPDKLAPVEAKIASFAAGYGTVLYFDDTQVTQAYADNFSPYRDHFRSWADQANAMLQFTVWCALEDAGLGASVQHYNPLIDEAVKKEFGIHESWRLISQMPFGSMESLPDAKDFMPLADRFHIIE